MLGISVSGALAQSSVIGFQDIDGWYRPAIEYSAMLGLIMETSEDKFQPNTPITQATLVTSLGRFAEKYGKVIEDVSESDYWYLKYALWAERTQIIPEQELPFFPDDFVTREAFAVYLCSFLDYLEVKPVAYPTGEADDGSIWIAEGWSKPPYAPPLYGPDTDPLEVPSDWAQLPIMSLAAHNVIRGYPDGTIKPHALMTRAEICQVLMNVGQNYVFID